MPHYPMRIQPVDFNAPEPHPKPEAAARPVLKLRFKRLFERPFSRTSAPEKPSEEFEPSSVCLGKMVQNFIEGNNEKPTQRCGRRKCNCCKENSDEEPLNSSSIDALKNLVPCSSVSEMNLVADITKILEKNKISERRDEICRKIVADGLIALGFKASICNSKWEKTSSSLAGGYEYVDVMIKGERLIIDIDFRSEFIIATPTKAYQLVLRTLPDIFVGKASRLEKIISIVSEAGKQSMKKKGMHLPPWRKAGYVKAKWLSPFTRIGSTNMVFGDAKSSSNADSKLVFSNSNRVCPDGLIRSMKNWEPFEFRPKSVKKGAKIVTGLASIIEDKT